MPNPGLDELQLFRGKDFVVNSYMTIHHPTLGEICDYGEEKYYSMVANLCSTPSDYKVVLWDQMKLDWEDVEELDLFVALSKAYTTEDTGILFGDFPLSQFQLAKSEQNDELMLVVKDDNQNLILDHAGYMLMTGFLRRIHHLEKHVDRAPNRETKMYLLDKDRRRMERERRSRKKHTSNLVPLVSGLVNCEQFKYNHETVWNLPIYTFYDSVRRIQKIKSYNQIVFGGMIDFEHLDKSTLNWLGDLD